MIKKLLLEILIILVNDIYHRETEMLGWQVRE